MRRILAAIISFGILMAGASQGHSDNKPGVLIPRQLHLATVRIFVKNGSGLGAPISPTTILTASHVVTGDDGRVLDDVVWVDSFGNQGKAVVGCTDLKRDIAVLTLPEGALRTWFQIAKNAPDVSDHLWWTSFLYDRSTMTWVSGTYMGRDITNDMTVDGIVFSGASGGAIVNESGQLVAILQASALSSNPANAAHFRPYMTGRNPVGICSVGK
jgi:hypothetical protein